VLGLVALNGTALAGSADSVVAVVGEELVLRSQLNQALDFLRVAGTDTTLSDSALETGVLQSMIDDLVLQAQAGRESVDVTSAEAAAEAEGSIAALKDRFGGEDKFKVALAAEGLTEKGLRQRYEDEARRKLLSRRLMDKAGLTQIYTSPAEAERFYNENRDSIAHVPGRVSLAHILLVIMPGPQAESSGQKQMAEVMDVLARGGDFATVAGSFSNDRKTAGKGGDWGWVGTRDLPPELAMVVTQLKPGQISPPFRTREGYATLKLEERAGDRVRFRYLLIRVPITMADTLRARDLAETIRNKALARAAFDSLAGEYSGDPTTADSGGYLGEFLISGLTVPFDKVVAGLDSGQVSEPVLSEHGYHLVKVVAKQTERMMTYLEMQDGIRNYLYQQKLSQRLKEYLGRISRQVYVRRFV
jgi:peptidyl-prolyl cis-trans isomerase SurA